MELPEFHTEPRALTPATPWFGAEPPPAGSGTGRKKRKRRPAPPSRAIPSREILVVLASGPGDGALGCVGGGQGSAGSGGGAPGAMASYAYSAQLVRGGRVVEYVPDCAACRGKHSRHVCGKIHVKIRRPNPKIKYEACDACRGRHTAHVCGRGRNLRPLAPPPVRVVEERPPSDGGGGGGTAYCSVCLCDVDVARMVPLDCSHKLCVECSAGCGAKANGGVQVRCPLCREPTRLRLADRKRVVCLMAPPAFQAA